MSEEVTPRWTHLEAGPTASETFCMNATTSCFVCFSISATLTASTWAFSVMTARSSFGTTPSSAHASQMAISMSSHVRSFFSSVQMAAICRRV